MLLCVLSVTGQEAMCMSVPGCSEVQEERSTLNVGAHGGQGGRFCGTLSVHLRYSRGTLAVHVPQVGHLRT